MKKLLSLVITLAVILTMNIVGWADSQQLEVTEYTEKEFETMMQNNQVITTQGAEDKFP